MWARTDKVALKGHSLSANGNLCHVDIVKPCIGEAVHVGRTPVYLGAERK